jgi:glucose-6-phosphate 1-dehydrogenase
MSQIIPVSACDFVVFGGTGDLAQRKLLPALYHRDQDGQLSAESRIILASRAAGPSADIIAQVAAGARRHLPSGPDEAVWARFQARWRHVTVDGAGEAGWDELKTLLDQVPQPVRVYYLATGPELFETICARLADHGLATPNSRVVLEKPLGRDLESARAVNLAVGRVFSEAQTFRIDHYLGKEAVQNLMALRFANAMFEGAWNRDALDHVQITVAETVGVGTRGGYYDQSGALRDMVQNHLLQLLCLVAMEPPARFDADEIRDAKLRVLRALKPIAGPDVDTLTVRGQYRAGMAEGRTVASYLDDLGTAEPSRTETFVAMKVEVHSWRWAGVPFFLRTGKRMAERVSEIVLQFRPLPVNIFPAEAGPVQPNRLVVRLQPNEGIKLHLVSKYPGPGGMRLRPSALNIVYADAFQTRYPEAYERLLMDVVRGNPTLFMRRDEVEAAWSWIKPKQDRWTEKPEPPRPYPAGSWGPSQAVALIERDGRTWHDDAE